MKNNLSHKQEKFIKAIWDLIDKNRLPPTFSELRHELGITNQAIYDQARRLERKGYIYPSNGKIRGFKLTTKAINFLLRAPELIYGVSYPISFSPHSILHTISMINSTTGLPAELKQNWSKK